MYVSGTDSWVNDEWWIAAALNRYERFMLSDNLYCTNTLEVLLHYFPDKYKKEARTQISKWWSLEENHDPEYWWQLGVQVWPDHPMFEALYECPENDYEWSILAKLDHKDARLKIQKDLDEYQKEEDYYWVNEVMRCLAKQGGESLVRAVISEDQCCSIREKLTDYAKTDTERLSLSEREKDDILCIQESALKVAVYLEWKEIIDALSTNFGYIRRLDWYDMAWWSLTKHRQKIVNDFVIEHQPYKIHPTRKGLPNDQKLMLAIAWHRTISE